MKKVRCPKSKDAADILDAWNGELSEDFLKRLWPNLALISAWDTSTSAIWAKQLRSYFPSSAFLGKGLWATEGVVTIPWKNRYPLAQCSHFYEFMDMKSGKVYPAWGLHIGQEVRPVLTTGSGLLRYAMKDRIRVVDYIHQCPCFEFMGRIDGVDMVGEKLSPEVADAIINQFSHITVKGQSVLPVSLLAITAKAQREKSGSDQKPFYTLLCEFEENVDKGVIDAIESSFSNLLEQELRKHFHYNLARDLGQLASARVYCRKDARAFYTQRGVDRGMVSGNIKVEPLVLWDGELPGTLLSSSTKSGDSDKLKSNSPLSSGTAAVNRTVEVTDDCEV